jgi:ketosteroid isomerase-like protein
MERILVIPGEAKRRPGIQLLNRSVRRWILARACGLAGMTTLASVLLFATPLALAHPPARLSTQSEQAVAGEVEAFYKALAAAVAAKDVGKLKGMYAESFTHTHTSAKLDGRDARIVSLLSGEASVELLPFATRSIAIHAGGWAAIVRGMTQITSAADAKTYAVHWSQTLTRADNDGWQLVVSHATRGAETGQ